MPKLVYVYGDDSRMLNTLLTSLRNSGYSVEYTSVSNEMGRNRVMAVPRTTMAIVIISCVSVTVPLLLSLLQADWP